MHPDSAIFVAGHRGLVGSQIYQCLQAAGFTNLLVRSRSEVDLTRQAEVERFFTENPMDYVFLAAAKVGGILANDTYGGEFIRDNLLIQSNVIDAAYRNGVKKLLFLGSSCIYPRLSPQPIREEYLLTGALEPTNEPYAVAKIAGIKMCQAYRRQFGFNAISLMPTNLYGPGDNFDLQNAHVLPAMIRRFHEARMAQLPEVTLWGTGTPSREFLHVRDLAEACIHLMRHYDDGEIVNVGVGEDISIRDLAARVASIIGYSGDIVFDTTKPDGTPRKLLDVSRLHQTGWRARIGLDEGISETYQWFLANTATLRV